MILQPFDTEVGAGTLHPATVLRSLGPKPWNVAMYSPLAARGWPIRGKSQPLAALLPIPSDHEAQPAEFTGFISGLAGCNWH